MRIVLSMIGSSGGSGGDDDGGDSSVNGGESGADETRRTRPRYQPLAITESGSALPLEFEFRNGLAAAGT